MFSFLFGGNSSNGNSSDSKQPLLEQKAQQEQPSSTPPLKQTADYVLLIMNCEKYAHKRERQRATWLKSVPDWLPYYHVIGNPQLSTPYLFNNDDHILYVKTPDDYNSLPQKVIAAYMAVDTTFSASYKYIFKTDDDQTTIQTPQKIFDTLKVCLEHQASPPNYGGYIVDVKTDHVSQYYRVHKELPDNLVVRAGKYCNGRFYILSAAAVRDLSKKADLFKGEYFEDYAVGRLLDDSLREPIFKIDTNKNFRDM